MVLWDEVIMETIRASPHSSCSLERGLEDWWVWPKKPWRSPQCTIPSWSMSSGYKNRSTIWLIVQQLNPSLCSSSSSQSPASWCAASFRRPDGHQGFRWPGDETREGLVYLHPGPHKGVLTGSPSPSTALSSTLLGGPSAFQSLMNIILAVSTFI